MGAGPSGGGVRPEINVTPLVDVVLVLLIIFMVITPMLQRGKDVQLPKAGSIDKDKKDADTIVLSITANRQLYLENDALADGDFGAQLKAKLRSAPQKKLLLKGDTSLAFEDVRRVMRLARSAGAKGVALGVEEVKK